MGGVVAEAESRIEGLAVNCGVEVPEPPGCGVEVSVEDDEEVLDKLKSVSEMSLEFEEG